MNEKNKMKDKNKNKTKSKRNQIESNQIKMKST